MLLFVLAPIAYLLVAAPLAVGLGRWLKQASSDQLSRKPTMEKNFSQFINRAIAGMPSPAPASVSPSGQPLHLFVLRYGYPVLEPDSDAWMKWMNDGMVITLCRPLRRELVQAASGRMLIVETSFIGVSSGDPNPFGAKVWSTVIRTTGIGEELEHQYYSGSYENALDTHAHTEIQASFGY